MQEGQAVSYLKFQFPFAKSMAYWRVACTEYLLPNKDSDRLMFSLKIFLIHIYIHRYASITKNKLFRVSVG